MQPIERCILDRTSSINIKLLKSSNLQSEKGTPQYFTQKLKHFLQLQIEQLVAQPQIQWAKVVYRDPQIPNCQEVLEASQMPFAFATKTLNYLQAESWLTDVSSSLSPKLINSKIIEKGFYYCRFGEAKQHSQYLLLFANEPLSHTHRQFIKRTAASINEYLDEHQQNYQHRQKIQILEDLVQRVGHQLRHPLGLISLYAHNLQLLLKSKEQEQASVICKTAGDLDRTLTEIMQSASSAKLQLVPQDLNSLVHETLDEFQGWIIEKDLQIYCSDCPLILNIDPLQIKQAINNLLSNAIHFSPYGAKIFINWQEQQGRVLLTLRDEGPGLSSEDLEKLFKPFYTRRSEGTGLGLAIAQKIVLDHGGKLWAKNAPKKGAEFSLTLPRLISSINLSEDTIAC